MGRGATTSKSPLGNTVSDSGICPSLVRLVFNKGGAGDWSKLTRYFAWALKEYKFRLPSFIMTHHRSLPSRASTARANYFATCRCNLRRGLRLRMARSKQEFHKEIMRKTTLFIISVVTCLALAQVPAQPQTPKDSQ